MNGKEIKEAVREHYGKVAVESAGCCSSACGCGTDEAVGISGPMNDPYAGEDEAVVEAADLGLGCGTPTRFAGLTEGMTVLDLGSGAGIDVFVAAKQVGPAGRAIGLDMTDEMLERAERNRSKLGITNAEFRKGEIEDMPADSGSVDVILSNCVLNLVPEKRKAFSEMYRVLKQGGTFTVSDIVTDGPVPEKYRADARLWSGCVSGAEEKNRYLGMLREAGFLNVAVVSEKTYPVPSHVPFKILSITVSGRK